MIKLLDIIGKALATLIVLFLFVFILFFTSKTVKDMDVSDAFRNLMDLLWDK